MTVPAYKIPADRVEEISAAVSRINTALAAFQASAVARYEPRLLENEEIGKPEGSDGIDPALEKTWLDVKESLADMVPYAAFEPQLFLDLMLYSCTTLINRSGPFQAAALIAFTAHRAEEEFPRYVQPIKPLFKGLFARKSDPCAEDANAEDCRMFRGEIRDQIKTPLSRLWYQALVKCDESDREVETDHTNAMLDTMPKAGLRSDMLLEGFMRFWTERRGFRDGLPGPASIG